MINNKRRATLCTDGKSLSLGRMEWYIAPAPQHTRAAGQASPQLSWRALASPTHSMAVGAAASRQVAVQGQAEPDTPAGQNWDEPKAYVLATLWARRGGTDHMSAPGQS